MKKETLFTWTVLLLITVAISCKSKDAAQDSEKNTVIVQLHDSESVVQLEESHTEYSLKKEKVLSRPMHIFLFRFNSEKIQNTELVELLKKSDLVKEAQLNRNVTLRN
ncbi:hypothetical protein POV27_08395 [Aureisphaera galaxeae]|uniref:hypothetical protein n=1 Tax=Aureisphaera galaxeae TaxID=1538023 RepID=UPI002350D77E|nr:hypothetical protein [Aureisphaera galaxeae]MDC8004070.1 hypothetical protein [Aureisphaera galaxeae]